MVYQALDSDIKKCCFTGYRPSKLPFNVNIKNKAYFEFENLITNGILKLIEENCLVFYTGMAMGFDILCAENVLLIKRLIDKPIKLICAIPFLEQDKLFPEAWKNRYFDVLNRCDETVIISNEYFKGCYQRRNMFMVDNSDYVMTWFDGKAGGTKNTIDYAVKKNRFILNLNENSSESYFHQVSFDVFD